MPKYYISCGQTRDIIDRPTPREAAIFVLNKYSGRGNMPDYHIFVSETGYNNTENKFETDELLKEIYEHKFESYCGSG